MEEFFPMVFPIIIYNHGNQNIEDRNAHHYIFLLSASERSSQIASQSVVFRNQLFFLLFSSSAHLISIHIIILVFSQYIGIHSTRYGFPALRSPIRVNKISPDLSMLPSTLSMQLTRTYLPTGFNIFFTSYVFIAC